MDVGPAEVLSEGRRALARGDWAVARAPFEQAASAITSGEALDGLAQALSSEGGLLRGRGRHRGAGLHGLPGRGSGRPGSALRPVS